MWWVTTVPTRRSTDQFQQYICHGLKPIFVKILQWVKHPHVTFWGGEIVNLVTSNVDELPVDLFRDLQIRNKACRISHMAASGLPDG
jgi:hypothetical protein